MKRLFLLAGFLILFSVEILSVYFIMPFPGSQKANTIGIAFWLRQNIFCLRVLGILMVAYPMFLLLGHSNWGKRVAYSVPLALYCLVFYFVNFRLQADKMFYQPKHKNFSFENAADSTAGGKLVIGIVINGEAKAYPVQIIGYHHQVRDSVGNTPVLVTYCTVCRTGRVYSPIVKGRPETFRLVGMDHFNAMFEDATTKSWWRQATGVAVAGLLKGSSLKEILSQQLTWRSWIRLHPQSLIMLPDSTYKKQYDDLADYDKGNIKGSLEKRDSSSWAAKSWVVGVVQGDLSRAYDWNGLVRKRIIQDSLSSMPILIALEKDTASFHVWSRKVKGRALTFDFSPDGNSLKDKQTHSVWNMDGECISGSLGGSKLEPLQAYQEFWHSWKTFHPYTERN